ncbi:MAG: radical SAM protein [Candidatus Sungiibacteriota bacterium]|uniref:Radical SAM protein n=1 Tax=Candidatus Sungiibacteriota bacterium TaxID=2750080 RepID=A0A7T5RJS4_9BACT|nr:MAG: radical SAM protein [Candidatus Sungbacteria bacterium]
MSIPVRGFRPRHPADVVGDIQPNEFRGLKVTFVNMPLRETAKPHVPPEGPLILAAILRLYGAIPTIIDLNAYRICDEEAGRQGLVNGRHLTFEEAEDLLRLHFNQQGEQDIVAFSGMITTLRWQEKVAKMIRRLQPDCFLVTGNGLATELKAGLFNWMPELDAIAHSEGDDVMIVMARDVKRIKELGMERAARSGNLSPYYTGEMGGRHRFLYAGDRPKNLDAVPFGALDLLESDPYGRNLLEIYITNPVWGLAANNSSATAFTMERSLTTVSSRGCPYACAFCYRGAQGERNYGMRSVNHIARQIREFMDRYNIDFVGFPDDNFAISKPRCADFPRVFAEYGIRIRWGTHTRLDEADQRIIPMSESGCIYIGFGAESASAHVLGLMNKGGFILKNGLTPMRVRGREWQFPTTMINGIRNCRDVGIHANCTWIMAYPGETLEDLKTSVAFILWQEELMTEGLIPGTPEYEMAKATVNRKMFTATSYPGTAMFSDPAARALLSQNFGVSFDASGEPICDEAFHHYVVELDDATKVLHNKDGEPLNFGAMPMDQFLEAREYVDRGEIERILEM